MAEKTRLELAHKKWHSTVARLVSPPYKGTPEEIKAIMPYIDEAGEEFRLAFLKDENEAIAFLSRNRLEVENFFGDLYLKFKSPEVYDAVYNYYARNLPSKSKAEIELILKRKCGIEGTEP